MRVTDQLNFTNSISNTISGQNNLYKVNQQLNTGLQIQNSYEDASKYIESTRLEYELQTLEQVDKATSSALALTKNADQALKDMKDLLTNFKTKLTQAANDSQNTTSRQAIAAELSKIKEQIINLANTNINGQYLFSGSKVNTKPLDENGNYYGNDNVLNAVTGANTQSPYNIPGYDLFFKADNDYKKQISTNVNLTDNRFDLNLNPDKTTYLKGEDTISKLIGLNYVANKTQEPILDAQTDFITNPKDFPASTLYVQGTRPDGSTFKSAVLMNPGDTMQAMLDKISALYGNTDTNKVVDISINDSGQIQITDLRQGNNLLDFHAVAFTPQTDTNDTLNKLIQAAQDEGISMAEVTNRAMTAAMQASNNNITNITSPVTIQVNNEDFDLNLYQSEFIKSNMTDTAGNASNGADFDNVFFQKEGNEVFNNVSQIIRQSGAYASDSTKLSEVGNANSQLNLRLNSKGGVTYNVTINLANSSVSYVNAAGNTVSFPIMHTNPATGTSAIVTASNDITYKQINDIIGLFASDQMPTASINAVNNQVNANDYANYTQALDNSRVFVNVSMDYKGRINVKDRLSTSTNIEVALSNSQSGVFQAPPYTTTANVAQGANLVFSANNSLVIDEPNVDLIKDLDLMIEAVLHGTQRADANSTNPRNTGMQGALERIDHLFDHVNKQHTTVGAYSKSIETTNSRTKLLATNIQELKSNVIDADYAQSMIYLMQAQLAYQTSMKATATISQLSLLNYM